ncbi:ATP-binding protein [Niallia sp. XMNu-256]|uniref:CHASE3 domain-containing protein n=1 Tax=Niallia sp. XMNu-256 TaxID=3082444 RepID=UPI0030D5C46C
MVMNRMADLQNEIDYVSQREIEVHNLTNYIQKNLLDMESGMRGYVISGDEEYLESYYVGNRSWQDNYNKLYSLLEEDGRQQQHLEKIKPIIVNWVSAGGEFVITQRKENNIEALNEFFERRTGKRMMDEIRTQFDSFIDTEKNTMAKRIEKLNQENRNLNITLIVMIILVTVITISTAIILSNSIVNTIRQVIRNIRSITDSEIDLTTRIKVKSHDETRELADAMNDLLSSLEKQSWIQKNTTDISAMYQEITDTTELSQTFITKLAPLLEAAYGVVYLRKSEGRETHYVRVSGYAITDEPGGTVSFRMGEGLIGQAAFDKRIFLIDDMPEEHFKVTSGLGESSPRHLLIAPIIVDGQVEAVIELAALQPFLSHHLTLLDELQDKFGSAIINVNGRMEVERLLAESQQLTEELQVQSEELQAQAEELQMQQDQLSLTNELLEEQKQFAEQRAYDLKMTKDELEEYSLKLEKSSQYKSDFLANMSHELRTPLNSIIILSQMLMENENNQEMDMEEVREYSRVVFTSGKDLLRLIDDILDLSKVEAGKMEILADEVNVTEIPQLMKNLFDPVAAKKNVSFEVKTDSDIPPVILTDGKRLQQIVKNLLSNAFKFTNEGSVTLQISSAESEKVEELLDLDEEVPVLAISVTDTGIGIPHEKQQIIFEAFRQVDGTTNRQFGGTGLGLSICREFIRLLGGTIELQSEPGKGSTFTVYVPSMTQELEAQAQEEVLALEEAAATTTSEMEKRIESTREEEVESSSVEEVEEVEDGSFDEQLFKGKKVLLVEDDGRNILALVKVLEKKGMKIVIAKNGQQAIDTLQESSDFDMIFMDIMMPVMGGYEAMQIIRNDLQMHSIPIIALTAKAMKGERDKCIEAGASDYITKPLDMDQLFSLMRVWLTEQVNRDE